MTMFCVVFLDHNIIFDILLIDSLKFKRALCDVLLLRTSRHKIQNLHAYKKKGEKTRKEIHKGDTSHRIKEIDGKRMSFSRECDAKRVS